MRCTFSTCYNFMIFIFNIMVMSLSLSLTQVSGLDRQIDKLFLMNFCCHRCHYSFNENVYEICVLFKEVENLYEQKKVAKEYFQNTNNDYVYFNVYTSIVIGLFFRTAKCKLTLNSSHPLPQNEALKEKPSLILYALRGIHLVSELLNTI